MGGAGGVGAGGSAREPRGWGRAGLLVGAGPATVAGESRGRPVGAGEGGVYPWLSRLRKDALVTTPWRESLSGPPRRYYALTPAGHRALADFRIAWGECRTSVDQLLEGKARS